MDALPVWGDIRHLCTSDRSPSTLPLLIARAAKFCGAKYAVQRRRFFKGQSSPLTGLIHISFRFGDDTDAKSPSSPLPSAISLLTPLSSRNNNSRQAGRCFTTISSLLTGGKA